MHMSEGTKKTLLHALAVIRDLLNVLKPPEKRDERRDLKNNSIVSR